MAKYLKKYYDALLQIKTYLIKIGPQRRASGTICSKKLEEANVILKDFEKDLNEIHVSIKQLSNHELILINSYSDQVSKLFEEIKGLCCLPSVSKTMEVFSLKLAVSLLPVMNDNETVTKQLISSIELYASMLDEKSKPLLIQFVLKTRLSEGAKLKLNQKYDTVKLLVDDMKKFLLTKKSFTALQEQLLRCTQNHRDIEDYGKEIEKLFVDLTISQAEGDPEKYEFLKSLNEKTAIRRFVSGLRNNNLSTIISSRNYDKLNDAIRGAQDEQISLLPDRSVMTMAYKNSARGRCFQNRGGSSGYQFQRDRHSQRGYGHPTRGQLRGGYQNSTMTRGIRGARGQYNTNNYRSNRGRNNFYYRNATINSMNSESNPRTDVNAVQKTNGTQPNQFFRE